MRWHSRSVRIPVEMAAVRRMWGLAWRVDQSECGRSGTRCTTILLGTEEDTIGWVAVRWRPGLVAGVIHRIGWADGRSERDAWLAFDDLAGACPLLRAA